MTSQLSYALISEIDLKPPCIYEKTVIMKKKNGELLSTQTDQWNTRFGFYWYNDQEIFEFSQEDFNRRAEEFAGIGINHVITFSCTHFRWSFRRYWDQITERHISNTLRQSMIQELMV